MRTARQQRFYDFNLWRERIEKLRTLRPCTDIHTHQIAG